MTTKHNQNISQIVPCPNCKKSVLWDQNSLYRPFCSKRCKLIDLGDWASENHSIPGTDVISDESEGFE
jgi:hypothetical protein